MKLTNLWKRMALRGKILSVFLLLLFLSLIFFIGISIYNIPSLVQNRAIQSVNALFAENDELLAEGVTHNTSLISDAQKKVNKVQDDSLRLFLSSRLNTAQKMVDAFNGVNSLYTTNEDGTHSVIKNIQLFQIDNINKNLAELDALGKTKFTESVKANFTQALAQYEICKQIDTLFNALYDDGAARTQLSKDATTETINQIEALLDQLENADLKNDITFSLSQTKQQVAEQEANQAAQRRAEEAAREAERKAKEEQEKTKKPETDKKSNDKIEKQINKIIDTINP
ncbi:MAG: hypothetical protein RR310_00830 [Eubacterium sp.]